MTFSEQHAVPGANTKIGKDKYVKSVYVGLFQRVLPSILLIVSAMVPGCGTSYMQMNRMAGYVGSNTLKMYVVKIEGKDADQFRGQLYEALADDGQFEPERYGVAAPQPPDSTTNMPSIILSGFHRADESTRYFTEGTGNDEKKYRQRTETHEFQYSIRDPVTGEELEGNVMRQEFAGPKEEDQGIVAGLLGDAVKGLFEGLVGIEAGHRKMLIRDFVATLHFHPEKRTIGLFDNKEIPELKEGVDLAKKGKWAEAIPKFQAGAENHPNSEFLHKAYFNLGIAYEYNHEFEKALTSLRLADELAPLEGYVAEIDRCTWFARQYQWQQRYAGPG